MIVTDDWALFKEKLDKKFIIQAPFCAEAECEENIKKESARYETKQLCLKQLIDLFISSVDEGDHPGAPAMGAKSLCIPLEQPKPLASGQKCVHPSCGKLAKCYTLYRSQLLKHSSVRLIHRHRYIIQLFLFGFVLLNCYRSKYKRIFFIGDLVLIVIVCAL